MPRSDRPEMKYRAEIDGLRAIAVLPVILFHAGVGHFSGGFIGVDVFFVISGYLITSLILQDMAVDGFSTIEFYERRARRILPALFFVMLMSLPLACALLAPMDLEEFGGSLIAVSGFVSNIFFWQQSGYFSSAAELKPLLHTWSLAIEEQFYILFPAFLVTAWRFGITVVVWLLVALCFSSLAVTHWTSLAYPSVGFYMLPVRAWELLIGVLLAFYIREFGHFRGPRWNQWLSVLGLFCIFTSLFYFSEETPHPSLLTVLPTFGTGLLILCAVPGTLAFYLLSLRALVGLGLLSYSAYLWHQPILVFSRHYRLGQGIGDSLTLVFLLVAIFAAAWVSWKYVETPFRNRLVWRRKAIFLSAALGMFAFSGIGLFMVKTNGLEQWKLASYTENQRDAYIAVQRSVNYDMYDRMLSSQCKFWVAQAEALPNAAVQECISDFGSPLVVIGDSHGMNVYNMVAQSKQFPFVIGIARHMPRGGCRPQKHRPGCHYEGAKRFVWEIADSSPIVIYHQSGSYLFTDAEDRYEPSLNADLVFDEANAAGVKTYLSDMADSGAEVIWLGPFAEYRIDPRSYPTVIKPLPISNLLAFAKLESEIHRFLGTSTPFQYVPFDSLFVLGSEVVFDDCLIWRDADHFSSCGEMHIAENANWEVLKSNAIPPL